MEKGSDVSSDDNHKTRPARGHRNDASRFDGVEVSATYVVLDNLASTQVDCKRDVTGGVDVFLSEKKKKTP